jgi:DNA-binding beta-propeller fold protein YncE
VVPPSGLQVRKVGRFELSGIPWGAACDAEGSVAVCVGRSVYFYTKEGRQLAQIQLAGHVWDVAVADNKFYITECHTDNGRVFVCNKQGQSITTVKVGYKGRGGVAVSSQHIYVTSSQENVVYRMSLPDCTNKQVFIKNTLFKKYLNEPCFVATNDQHIAVSCYKSHQVCVFNLEGKLHFVYGGEGSGPGKLDCPYGVALDQRGRLLVCDYNNDRVSIVSPQGQHLGDIKLDQEGLEYPSGLALNHEGQLVVACSIPKAVIIYKY